MSALPKPKLIYLKPNQSQNGQLHFIEEPSGIPFNSKRLFWLDQVTSGTKRGIHAHREDQQVLICLAGQVTANLENLSCEQFSFELDSPSKALYIPPMVWTEFTFGPNAVLLGISDKQFSESDYIRDRTEFEHFQESFQADLESF
jgi:hypothetical protein